MGDWAAQCGSGVRFEWGPGGARRLTARAACPVVVDVLSFTTAVRVVDACLRNVTAVGGWLTPSRMARPSAPSR
ncbi:hypothetical protein ACQEWB_49395 [Streptomyces sp. CA-249302]|uniref:hypothetical protein n=1 Tax=Streptomyces sp. CA-249302 TaxID=3240058 RepID=UPI003D8CE80C